MNLTDQVLEALQDSGAPLSGEELAQRFGVSRNSVWKAVNRLKEAGYEITAATNRGYQLVGDSDVLSAENIRRQLGPAARDAAIEVRDRVTSTNTLLKEIAEQGGREGMVIVAQEQTAGKGRLGRSFYSPKGTGLYLSILLRPSFSVLLIPVGGPVHHHGGGGSGSRGHRQPHRRGGGGQDQMGQRRVLPGPESLRHPDRGLHRL